MDNYLSRKNSFKSRASSKNILKLSAAQDVQLEQLSILLDSHPDAQNNLLQMNPIDPSDGRQVVVKINPDDPTPTAPAPANAGKIWRESSYNFFKDGNGDEPFDFQQREQGKGQTQDIEDPPSKLIGHFLHKQKASGEMSLDMDLEMDELQRGKNNRSGNLPPVDESPSNHATPREFRVSFETPVSNEEGVRRRSKDLADGGDGDVLRCTSNASFESNPSYHRQSSLLKAKTKSRLMDQPDLQPKSRLMDQPELKSGRVRKSGQLRSGFMAKGADDEEDDPLLEGDLPEEYQKEKLSVWTLLEWASLVLIIGALVCSLALRSWRLLKLWKLDLWKWEVLVLVLICGRLVSGWGIRIIVFFIERNFLLRKRVLYFVYGIKKPVQNCLWLGLVLLAWHLLFDKRVERETNSKVLQYVTKILVCLLVGTLVWLVKTLVVKVLASSFHVSTYFDRIQESLFNQYVIETLSGPPLIEIRKNEEEEERTAMEIQKLQNAGATIPPDLRATASHSPKSGRLIGSGRLLNTPRGMLSRALSKEGDEGITIDHLHKLNPKNISAWNMKRLMNLVRHGVLSTLDERILDSTYKDESTTHIRSEVEAKAAARKIFQNVAKPGSKYIYVEDLMRFMREDEALRATILFEGASESRKISKSSLKNWVVNAFRERRALALTLDDTKTAVKKLHHMVNIVVGIVLVVIWLLILGIATTKFLVFLSSQLLLVAFIFGNTCKTVFEALIFLFVMHPFDVGDRCEIDGVQMVVEEMNILTTIFLRYDNQKIMFPNAVLATKAISNYYRSPDMGDAVEFCVHISTPAEKISLIKQRINSYIEKKNDHWYPTPMIIFKDVEEFNRVRIAVWLTHRMNHQDMGEKWSRRALLVEEMTKIFRELDIQYRLFPLDVNIRAMPPETSTRVPSNWTPH